VRNPTPTKREGAGAPPVPERFEPTPGLVVAGRYCVERVIGEGGMGIVVAATHVELDQPVAIKFLLPDAMRHPEVVERFLREARVAAKVNSEHVARVTDVGRMGDGDPEGVPFIVMEYLEGSDLGQRIAAGGRLPLDEACEIGLQACEALAEVHAAGIVHRDLKPSNLFVTRRSDGSPCLKLLDFGISKFTNHPDDSTADPALTATATIMGSPSYMSPEQLRSTKEVDARTDVWALGAVLYEAITGKPAFRGETVPQVCFLIGSSEPAPPSSLRADIPAGLERAILSCLDKNAETRATLVDLARALVDLAPERGRASLERVEAVLGAPRSKKKDVSIPVLPRTATAPEVARTQASWGDERKGKRRGGGPLVLLAVVAAGVFGVGVYTGQIDVKALRGQVGSAATAAGLPGATSAVGSVVASATAAVESLIPSALPALPSALPALPSAGVDLSPLPSPSASETADDEDEDVPADSASATASGSAAPPPRYAMPVHPHPRPKHYVHKPVHRRHY
jgi:tRNA A-37 threonylcarbamoyl transferase component Bud32